MVKKVELRVLEKLVSNSEKFDCVPVLAIQHLRPDTYHFFQELCKIGFNPLVISGIEYSTDPKVLAQLKEDGHKIENPENKKLFEPTYWDELIENDIKKWKESDKKYLILEDGGYIGSTFHESREKFLEICKGAVEQTANGFWKYQKLEEENKLKIPVYTVSNSKLKELAESKEVGLAISKSLETKLDQLGDSLNHKIVAVLGFGNIGKKVAEAIKSRNAEVVIFDTDSIRMTEAVFSSFITVTKQNAIASADIIIGCTGKRSLLPDDYTNVKDGVILVNGTSKRVEYDIEWLNENSTNTETINNNFEFEINNNKIIVLNKGEPINFDAAVSVSPETIDIVISEMFLCMKKIMEGGLENKTYTISPEDERKVSDLWLEIYKNQSPS